MRCAQVLTLPFKSRLINRRDPDPLGRRVRQEFNLTSAQGLFVILILIFQKLLIFYLNPSRANVHLISSVSKSDAGREALKE